LCCLTGGGVTSGVACFGGSSSPQGQYQLACAAPAEQTQHTATKNTQPTPRTSRRMAIVPPIRREGADQGFLSCRKLAWPTPGEKSPKSAAKRPGRFACSPTAARGAAGERGQLSLSCRI
jgi:hypothetical protein